MPQFDVYEVGLPAAPLVIDIQSDLLRDIETRVVLPLFPASAKNQKYMKRLHPRITINDTEYALRTSEIAAVPAKALKKIVASLPDDDQLSVKRAIDFLIQGV